MKQKHIWLILLGSIFFLGHEWYQQRAFVPQMFITTDFVAAQGIDQTVYGFGDVVKWSNYKPLGYFFDVTRVVQHVLPNTQQGDLVNWGHDFMTLDISGQRIAWFGDDFSFSDLTKQPVRLTSDVWLVKNVVPPEEMPLPRQAVVWLHPTRRVSKSLKERAQAANIDLLDISQLGQRWLLFKNGEWERK